MRQDQSSPSPMEPLRRPAFARFWSGSSLTFFAAAMTTVAVDALVINELGASEAEVGVIRAVQFLPYLLVGLIAGALIDRWRKKPVLIATTAGSGIALSVIPVLWWSGSLNLAAVAVALFITGGFGVFTAAAQQPVLPSLVRRDELVSANARLGQSMTAAQTSGPPLGGGLVSTIGAAASLMASSVGYLLSAVLYARMKPSPAGADTPTPSEKSASSAVKRSIWRDIRAGMAFLYRHRTLTPLAISTHIWFLANSAAVTVFALFALRHLGLSPFLYGITLALAGVTGLLGALVAPRIGRRIGEGNAVIAARMLYPVSWAVVALAPQDPVWGLVMLCFAQALYGFCMGFEDPNEMGYCQAVTPAHLLGRMHATMRSANRSMAVIGALLGGVLAGVIGYHGTLWAIIAVFTAAAVVIGLSPMRGARALP
ncbi:MFS transporter [Nesterenkonia sp. MY13]|uniref:MFS transporter n=1 Tax=Nesterenkonia sedimenti TaxID=1463632 RepID=A0A7X8THI2_9MICC|nr:MFS transporter [Nesterenkonia sedimenti]NLS08505.1 MFS transporter [Nesterenkonia sedimenti]